MSHRSCLAGSVLFAFLAVPLLSQSLAVWKDPSPHTTRFVTVDKDVRLEVLDWGGSGRPIVLLAGGGNTAHVFDDFAPKLTAHYHVYGITRRGFGASGYSATDHPADRLGDDVVAVIDALNLKKPVLVGHSIAGVELSSVANSRPNRLEGLVYLDAAYSYAFDNGKGPSIMEIQNLQGPQPPPPSETDLASFSSLQKYYERVNGFLFPEAELRAQRETAPDGGVGKQRDLPGGALFMPLMTGTKKYTAIPVPALVIFANPHSQGIWVDKNADPSVQIAAKTHSAALEALTERQEKSVENGVPTAHVITLPGANHYVFLSNEFEVLKDIDAFLARPRFATGLFTDPSDYTNSTLFTSQQQAQLLQYFDWIDVGLTGNLRDYSFIDSAVSTVTGAEVNYQATGYTKSPIEAINYASVHDNQDFFDQVQLKSSFSDNIATRARRQIVAMGLVTLARAFPSSRAAMTYSAPKTWTRTVMTRETGSTRSTGPAKRQTGVSVFPLPARTRSSGPS